MRQEPQANRRAKQSRNASAAERAVAVLAGDGLLRLPEVLSVFPVGKSTWWAGIRESRYPQPVKLGPRCTAWRAADIRALIAKVGQ